VVDCDLSATVVATTPLSGTVVATTPLSAAVVVSQALSAAVVATTPLSGTVVSSQVLSATLVPTEIPGDLLLRLAATNGEQIINITTVDTIIVTSLPLNTSPQQGVVQTFIVTLTAKTHAGLPTSIEIELLDDDTLTAASPEVFLTTQGGQGGSSSIFPIFTMIPDAVVGDPLTDEEPVVNFSNTAERVVFTKGTVGALALAIRINGGSGVDYDFKVQVLGKRLSN